jgi:hypothetical protein
MSMEIVIPTFQLQNLLKQFEGAEDTLDNLARKTMIESVSILERIIKETAPVDAGTYRSSVSSKVIGKALDMIGTVFSPLLYAIIVESGRSPGTWPNIAAVTRWVERKRLATSSEMVLKIGFLVSRAIKNRGIEAKNIFENALDASETFIVKKFEWVCDEFIRSFEK